LLGSTSAGNTNGIAGSLDGYLKTWSSSVDGQIKQRRDQNTTEQSRLADRQVTLEQQHETAYQRYLQQFTQLQTMQGVMNHNVSLF
ncbi:flagellar filament capping protein FliD, partial [Acinetobacter baumannii]|uniref:flagellar filament capping protein FliD n=1 Tax=Acinetobacter baumannii TaxID=470 RepID=UPI00285DA0C4